MFMNFVDLTKVIFVAKLSLFVVIGCMIAVVAGGLYKINRILVRKACTIFKTVV